MKKTRLFFVVMAALVSVLGYAQNATVSGVVTDASNGVGAPFVSVQLKGTMIGTNSDANGAYSIEVPSNGVLVFSSIGYETVEVAVNGRRSINVALVPDSESLEETIVVAYGVQKKSSFVGSATQLS